MAIAGATKAVEVRVRRLRDALQRRVVGYPVSALVVVLVSAATVVLRRRVQSRLGLSPYDGLLYVRQARSLDGHGWLGSYSNLTLVKAPGYPLFISMCDRLGLGVKDAEQVVACCAALLVGLCVLVVSGRLAWALPVFVVCACDPIFLSSWSADYMRDALFASISVIMMTALFLTGHFLVVGRRWGWVLVTAGLSGLSLAGYVLTREEGLTVIPTAAVALGARPLWHVLVTRRWRGGVLRWAGRGLLRLVPAGLVLFLALAAPVGAVLAKDQQRYGEATISELADGSFMDAYAQWQRVDAGPVQYRIPISEAQRQAVYRVSAAARLLAPALERPTNPWRFSGCSTVPNCDYAGGWMTWAIRDAAAEAGQFSSAPHAAAFFQRLATEISDACAEGRLSCKPKLPSALQSVQRITATSFLDSFERLTGSLLSSKDQYQTLTTLVQVTPEQRAEFTSVDSGVPKTVDGAERQLADFTAHSWQYKALDLLYTALFPVAAVVGLILLLVLLVTRRGRRAAGPLSAFAVALLFGTVMRIALIAVVDAADYDADQPRYLYPAQTLLLAFAVVAIVEGLSRLDLRRIGEIVTVHGRGEGDPTFQIVRLEPGQTEAPVPSRRLRPLGQEVAFPEPSVDRKSAPVPASSTAGRAWEPHQ